MNFRFFKTNAEADRNACRAQLERPREEGEMAKKRTSEITRTSEVKTGLFQGSKRRRPGAAAH
jgi:hypothetical protein